MIRQTRGTKECERQGCTPKRLGSITRMKNVSRICCRFGHITADAPTHDEMETPPSWVGSKAYSGRFGTWNKALQSFIDRVNTDNLAESEAGKETLQSPANSRLSVPECEKRDIRLGLRYAVLKRDRFRCVVCGRSPATHLGVILHVDHTIPFSKGGKMVFENLRTLCEDCNLGKGNKHEA